MSMTKILSQILSRRVCHLTKIENVLKKFRHIVLQELLEMTSSSLPDLFSAVLFRLFYYTRVGCPWACQGGHWGLNLGLALSKFGPIKIGSAWPYGTKLEAQALEISGLVHGTIHWLTSRLCHYGSNWYLLIKSFHKERGSVKVPMAVGAGLHGSLKYSFSSKKFFFYR